VLTMKKRRNRIIGAVIVFLFISMGAFIAYFYYNAELEIVVVNKTGKPINGLEIQLHPGETFVVLPELKVGQSIKETITRGEVKDRKEVWVVYNNPSSSEVALGYIEAAYRGKMEVIIHKLEDGQREIEMKKLGIKFLSP
jgi:hypothetical protein